MFFSVNRFSSIMIFQTLIEIRCYADIKLLRVVNTSDKINSLHFSPVENRIWPAFAKAMADTSLHPA